MSRYGQPGAPPTGYPGAPQGGYPGAPQGGYPGGAPGGYGAPQVDPQIASWFNAVDQDRLDLSRFYLHRYR